MRATSGAAGYDLSASEACHVPPGGKALVPTGIALRMPPGHYGRIAPRSGLSWRHHTIVSAGVVDADYTGHVQVVLFNHSDDTLAVSPGDRVAQLILERISTPPTVEVHDIQVPDAGIAGTAVPTRPVVGRAGGGFGSTGV